MKRRFDKAVSNEFRENSSHENINEAIKLAMNMKVLDILEPTGKTIGELAEIVSRLQNADELEILDTPEYTGNLIPCS